MFHFSCSPKQSINHLIWKPASAIPFPAATDRDGRTDPSVVNLESPRESLLESTNPPPHKKTSLRYIFRREAIPKTDSIHSIYDSRTRRSISIPRPPSFSSLYTDLYPTDNTAHPSLSYLFLSVSLHCTPALMLLPLRSTPSPSRRTHSRSLDPPPANLSR